MSSPSLSLQVWLIDVSQSVEPTHPHGLEFLFRDCRNVSTVSPSPLCWIRKFKPDSRFHSFLFKSFVAPVLPEERRERGHEHL